MATEREERNRALTRRFYAVGAAKDRGALDAMLADDLVITEGASLPYAGTYRGRGALAALSARVAGHFGGMSLDIHEVAASGDWTFALLDILPGKGDTRVSLVEATRYDEDGRIVEIKPFYFDHDQVSRLGGG